MKGRTADGRTSRFRLRGRASLGSVCVPGEFVALAPDSFGGTWFCSAEQERKRERERERDQGRRTGRSVRAPTHFLHEFAIHARDPPDIFHHRLEFGQPALALDPLTVFEEVLRRDHTGGRDGLLLPLLLGRFERSGEVHRCEGTVSRRSRDRIISTPPREDGEAKGKGV